MLTTLKNFGHKLLGLYLIAGSALVATANTAFAQNQWTTPTGFGINEQNSAGIQWIGGAGTDAWDNIINVIKNFINYALGLLALIALGMLLWGGYKMVTSGGQEDAYKDGLKILKNAAIGIAFIAVSWFLVTFIFYVIGVVVN